MDRYTLRISYLVDVDVEVDHSDETPNHRKTGNYEAIREASIQYVPLGAREISLVTVRHLPPKRPETRAVPQAIPQADDSSAPIKDTERDAVKGELQGIPPM